MLADARPELAAGVFGRTGRLFGRFGIAGVVRGGGVGCEKGELECELDELDELCEIELLERRS